ncbi:D-Ala-D-Ala carboxypeptidase family metallohydrolase [Janthinobacterium agaricidamnosum]|uniref:Peptidase M15 family protein n=1 Tax=Janthinobacterium agaricidamnosum NBRC 102515 = DSM 9628 TaxID=1349767 RepID=W0V3D2_9BURK|nr:D-Ala-D-Ala carboxypeptidase family metallohydrolase [Janthinobacterium agaricidamnosum]CDG82100.1 peptidase M15 family protein [Janthinobacterium agaricidamnosum NBRC 102515 = DSM 9628]
MQLSQNFTLAELTASDYAARHGIDNTAPPAVQDELRRTAQMLQRIRNYLSASSAIDTPLTQISGYRCLALNRGIGSGDGSDHVQGMAADFKALRLTPYQICQALLPKLDEFGIGQIINELSWVHVSTRMPVRPINRIITIDRLGTRAGIVQGRP